MAFPTADLIARYEARSETAYSDGDAASTITDQVAGVLHGPFNLSGTGVTWEDGELNGRPVYRFDGSGGAQSAGIADHSGYTAWSMVIMAKAATEGSSRTWPGGFHDATSDLMAFTEGDVASEWGIFIRTGGTGGGDTLIHTSGADTTEWTTLVVVWDGATVSLYQDGTLVDSSSRGGLFDLDDISMGRLTSQLFVGDIALMAGWSKALDATDLEDLHDYVATVYGVGATGYISEVSADSPIAYWRMGDASGPLVDEIGSAHLALTGGPTLGQPGALESDDDTAVLFDGSNDKAEFDVPNWSGNYTVELWAKAVVSPQTERSGIFSSGNAPSPGGTFQISFDGIGGYEFRAHDDSGTGGKWGTFGASSTTEFSHLVVTCDGVGVQLYYNGSAVGSKLTNFTFGLFEFYRLGTNRGDDIFGNVVVDEVAIYDTALSDTRIAAHYEARLVFPEIRSSAATATAGTSHSPTMPATIESGDLLLAYAHHNSTVTSVTATGWSLSGSSNNDQTLLVRTATGSDTLTATSNSVAGLAWVIVSVSGAYADISGSLGDAIFTSRASGTDPNSVNTPAGWGLANVLWLVCAGAKEGTLPAISAWSTGYTEIAQVTGDFSLDVVGGMSYYKKAATSENPDSVTISGSPEGTAVMTIAVRPAEEVEEDPDNVIALTAATALYDD